MNADADFFWRESTHDGVYNVGQTVVRSDGNGGSSYIGSQATVQVEWRLQRHLTWTRTTPTFSPEHFCMRIRPTRT